MSRLVEKNSRHFGQMIIKKFWNDPFVLFNPALPVLRSFLALPGVRLLSDLHFN